MSKNRLKHSLDELFSDFSPPTPEGEAESSHSPPPSGVPAVADTPREDAPPGRQPLQDDAPRQRGSDEIRPLLEQEPLSGQKEDVDEDEKMGQEGDSSPEDTIRTWRAGWRGLASENTNGKGRTDSVKGSIGIRRRRLADGRRKSGEGEL